MSTIRGRAGFTIEYSALFDAILPALARLGLPVPLGGTSNHFRRETLIASGGWDPFNVTEDADLGFRMARRGWRTTVLASTTWEEAPATFRQWIRQRTRWLKGWMQTYLVHTRQPWRLNAELGLRGALGFHGLMGALILSALVHPFVLCPGGLSRPARRTAYPIRYDRRRDFLDHRLHQSGRGLHHLDPRRRIIM
jgi:glycosyltransferase XagB